MIVTVTAAQVALLREAIAKRDAAAAYAQTVLTTLTAGHVPAGAELTNIDADACTLTLRGGDDAG